MKFRYLAMCIVAFVMSVDVHAQGLTPPPVTIEDHFRIVMRDGFTIYQTEIGTQRFQFDPTAGKEGVSGMTNLESVKIIVPGSTPQEWATNAMKQMQPKLHELVGKLSTMRLMGIPAFPASGTSDVVAVMDGPRGIALQMKLGEPGAVSGKRTLTLAAIGGK